MENNNTSSSLKTLVEVTKVDTRIKKAELLPHPDSRLDSYLMKIHPISDEGIPYRDLTSLESKKESLRQLIDKLNVVKSTRYERTIEDTYCNVYSYDYCYFSKVYLPTIWWTEEALQRVLNGEEVEPVFGETVDNIYSSAIHDWFLTWGASFGWKRMTDLDEIQNKVNNEGGCRYYLRQKKNSRIIWSYSSNCSRNKNKKSVPRKWCG